MAVLLSFLFQLLEADTSDKALHDEVRSRLDDAQMNLFKTVPDPDFWHVFSRRVRSLDKAHGESRGRVRTCVVLDGLDECDWESMEFLINVFEDLCKPNPNEKEQKFKAAIVSRPKLPRKPQTDRQIDLDDENSVYHTNTLDDIRKFIRNEVSATRELEVQELDSLAEILSSRANRTFLWVSLAMKRLKTDEDLVQKIMHSRDLAFLDKLLPKGLYPMFDRMLLDALSGKRTGGGFKNEDASLIVSFVSMAVRPLEKEELRILSGLQASAFEAHFKNCSHMLSRMEGLSGVETFQLVHFSLKEYLSVKTHIPLKACLLRKDSRLLLEYLLYRAAPSLPRSTCQRLWLPLSLVMNWLQKNSHKQFMIDFIIPTTCLLLVLRGWRLAVSFLMIILITHNLRISVWRHEHGQSMLIRWLLQILQLFLGHCVFQIFVIHEGKTHGILFSACIRILEDPDGGLKKNICKLRQPDSFITKASAQFPALVPYACQYWVRHLQESDCRHRLFASRIKDAKRIKGFCQNHLLHWIEAMSLMKKVSDAIRAVASLEYVILEMGVDLEMDVEISSQGDYSLRSHPKLKDFVKDAKKFLLRTRSIFEFYPLQLYSSALVFSPSKSIIRVLFNEIAQDVSVDGVTRVDIESGLDQDWETQSTAMQVLEGRLEDVQALAFSSESSKLASLSSRNLVEIWDMTTSQVTRRLDYSSTSSWSPIALSPTGTKVAFFLYDGTLLLWDMSCVEPEKFLDFLPIPRFPDWKFSAVMFSPDGKKLACGKNNILKVLNVDDKQIECDKTVDYKISCICFSHDGKYMFTAGSRLVAWDTTKWTCQVFHQFSEINYVKGVLCTADGAVWCSSDYKKQAWGVATGEALHTLRHKSAHRGAHALSPNGIVVVKNPRSIELKTAKTERTIFRSALLASPPLKPRKTLSFTPDGSRLACGFLDGTIRVWDVAAAPTVEDSSISVHRLAISPDGKWIVSGSTNGTIQILSLITSDARVFKKPRGLRSFAVSPDVKRLALGWAHYISFWGFPTDIEGPPDLKITVDRGMAEIVYIGFSPDGTYLVVRDSNKGVRIYNSASGERLEMGIISTVNPVFSPDGCLLATLSPGKTMARIRVWDIENRTQWGEFSFLELEDSSTTLSSDGDKLAVGMVGTSAALIWSLKTDTVTFTQKRPKWLSSDVSWLSNLRSITSQLSNSLAAVAVAVSQDRDKLALMVSIDVVEIWDIRSESNQHKINAPSCEWTTKKVSISLHGDKIAAATKDGTRILLWNIDCRSSFYLCEKDASLVYNIPRETSKEEAVRHVKFLTDNTLSVIRKGSAQLFTLDILDLGNSPKPTESVRFDLRLNKFIFSPDASMLAITGELKCSVWSHSLKDFFPISPCPFDWNVYQKPEFSNPAKKDIFSVNSQGDWVYLNDVRILYLPRDHRPVRWKTDNTIDNDCEDWAEMGVNYAVEGNTVAIASEDRITVLRFSLSEEEGKQVGREYTYLKSTMARRQNVI